PIPPLMHNRAIHVPTWDPPSCRLVTHLYSHKLVELHSCLGMPVTLMLPNQSVEDGLTSLAIFMAHLATPTWYYDLIHIFGWERTVIGRIDCR
ncbi:hypothetical protein CROQUDRAFT_46058, partial [Cronartium quercuum f. sp. fusiforme G11]